MAMTFNTQLWSSIPFISLLLGKQTALLYDVMSPKTVLCLQKHKSVLSLSFMFMLYFLGYLVLLVQQRTYAILPKDQVGFRLLQVINSLLVSS